jgi:hypothetical protein
MEKADFKCEFLEIILEFESVDCCGEREGPEHLHI